MTMLRRVLLVALILYALLFVALSLDVMVRVWDWRAKFESPFDVAAILYFESMRTLTTLAGVAAATWAAVKAGRREGLQELPFALVLATIVYTKVIAFSGFPGAQQERLAVILREARVPDTVLELVFVQPAWTALPALAACLLLLAHYPRRLTPQDVAASGAADRRGAMRDVALAGTDVGHLTRQTSAAFLTSRLTRTTALYAVAFVAGTAYALVAAAADGGAALLAHAIAAGLAAAAVAVCVSMFRAAMATASGQDALFLAWLRRGVLAGGVLFVISGVTAVALRGNVVAVAALSMAPGAVLVGVGMALHHSRGSGPRAEVWR